MTMHPVGWCPTERLQVVRTWKKWALRFERVDQEYYPLWSLTIGPLEIRRIRRADF